MKKLFLFGLLMFAFFSCSTDNSTETKKYITDDDFKIKIVSWESRGDITDDGIKQNVLIESGKDETLTFVKATGATREDNWDIEYADKSTDGKLIFNNYWDNTPKIVDFTVDGKFTIEYDSRNDSQSGSYEISKTIVYYTKL